MYQLKSRPGPVVPSTVHVDITQSRGDGRPPKRPSPFWLTDQRLSVADRNRALAEYTRSSRSLLGM